MLHAVEVMSAFCVSVALHFNSHFLFAPHSCISFLIYSPSQLSMNFSVMTGNKMTRILINLDIIISVSCVINSEFCSLDTDKI